MSSPTLKEQFINVIDFNYEQELWHSRPEQPYMKSIEPFLNDLIQIAECHKQNKSFKLHKWQYDAEENASIDATIGKNIKEIRLQRNMTIEQLAEKSNLDADYLKGVESGMSILRIWALKQITQSLNINSSQILSF